MPSDTSPLPASEFRRLEDRIIEELTREPLFTQTFPDGIPWINHAAKARIEAALADLQAARAASPVTLEEHLLAEERRTEIESIKACDVDDNPDLVAIVTAADDARNARKQHARRLAGEGGA